MASFAEKVKEQREGLKLSQEQLGHLVGVSRRSIITYETGAARPRESTLHKLAEALGVTQRYLMNDDSTDPQDGIDEEPFVQAARDALGKKGADEMAELLMKNEALFSGSTLSEDQKDMFYEAISRSYFSNKKDAREKYKQKKKQARAAS